MIIPITEKPFVFDKPTQEGDLYFVCVDDALDPYAYILLNCKYKPWATVHLEVTEFTHSNLKEAVDVDWPAVTGICRDEGCEWIIAETKGNIDGTRMFQRFVGYFGFTDFIERVTSIQNIRGEDG